MGKKIIAVTLLTIVSLVLALIIFIGPWPVYKVINVEKKPYFKRAFAAVAGIDESGKNAMQPSLKTLTSPLEAGWSKVKLLFPEGTPLAGYGDRKGNPSIGYHDDLYVKAVVLRNSTDGAVIAGADMLIVPENISKDVMDRLAGKISIPAENIIFNASHTHSGPGASTRGLLARIFGGKYDRRVERLIVDAFEKAILEAENNLGPASYAHFAVEAPELIRNRVRNISRISSSKNSALVDAALDCLVLKHNDGASCIVVRYSAHPTIIGHENMSFSGGFPGYLQRYLEHEAQAEVIYLGGALGSMGSNPPPGNGDFERAMKMGQALGKKILMQIPNLTYKNIVELRSAGIRFKTPPLQLRISRRFRLSPIFLNIAGVNRKTRLTGLRIDRIILLGFPADFSGELSKLLKNWGHGYGFHIIPLSFNGDYAGYISPDVYYDEVYEDGGLAYETAIMSWCGPNQEAFFLNLAKSLIEVLGR
jgi:hypothetical protein